MRRFSAFVALLLGLHTFAQDTILPPDVFMDWVAKYHPFVGQSERVRSIADAEIRQMKGFFDPVLSGSIQNKDFDQKEYYFMAGGQLSIPTRLGPSFELGYDQNRGEFLNPQNDLPEQGLWYLGIEIPILQGLITDEERTAVRIAEAGQEVTDNEVRDQLNDLFYRAQAAYWAWASSYSVWLTRQNAELTSYERYLNTVRGYEEGFYPAIDTLEANIQWQNRRLLRQEALKTYVYAQLELSSFIWDSTGTSLVLADSIRPEPLALYSYELSSFEEGLSIDSLQTNHPKWQAFTSQIDLLRFDQRLKSQKILPKANLRYDLLQDAATLGSEGPTFDFNDHYWSLKVELPLFLRDERFALKQSRLKVEQTDLKRSESWIKTKNYWGALRNELVVLSEQVDQYDGAVDGYLALLNAETRLFFSGESSLFVVNSRELKWLESVEKLIELRQKYRTKRALWYYYGGLAPLQP